MVFIERGEIDLLDGAFVVVDVTGIPHAHPVGRWPAIMLEPGTRMSLGTGRAADGHAGGDGGRNRRAAVFGQPTRRRAARTGCCIRRGAGAGRGPAPERWYARCTRCVSARSRRRAAASIGCVASKVRVCALHLPAAGAAVRRGGMGSRHLSVRAGVPRARGDEPDVHADPGRPGHVFPTRGDEPNSTAEGAEMQVFPTRIGDEPTACVAARAASLCSPRVGMNRRTAIAARRLVFPHARGDEYPPSLIPPRAGVSPTPWG